MSVLFCFSPSGPGILWWCCHKSSPSLSSLVSLEEGGITPEYRLRLTSSMSGILCLLLLLFLLWDDFPHLRSLEIMWTSSRPSGGGHVAFFPSTWNWTTAFFLMTVADRLIGCILVIVKYPWVYISSWFDLNRGLITLTITLSSPPVRLWGLVYLQENWCQIIRVTILKPSRVVNVNAFLFWKR